MSHCFIHSEFCLPISKYVISYILHSFIRFLVVRKLYYELIVLSLYYIFYT